MKNLPHSPDNFTSPLHKLATFIAAIVAIGLALMFSAVMIAVILVIGMIGWAYLWWKTRELRKQMRGYAPDSGMMEEGMGDANVTLGKVFPGDATRGEVIEGEVIRVSETREIN